MIKSIGKVLLHIVGTIFGLAILIIWFYPIWQLINGTYEHHCKINPYYGDANCPMY